MFLSSLGFGGSRLLGPAHHMIFKIVRVANIMHAFLAAYAALIYYEWSLLTRLA